MARTVPDRRDRFRGALGGRSVARLPYSSPSIEETKVFGLGVAARNRAGIPVGVLRCTAWLLGIQRLVRAAVGELYRLGRPG